MMARRESGYDFIGPSILNILKNSTMPMTKLAVSYMVNQKSGKIVNISVVKRNLDMFVKNNKVTVDVNKLNGIASYTII